MYMMLTVTRAPQLVLAVLLRNSLLSSQVLPASVQAEAARLLLASPVPRVASFLRDSLLALVDSSHLLASLVVALPLDSILPREDNSGLILVE